MIKKLQLKFIFINMLIVTVMLISIFCIIYVSTQNNLSRESIQMMSSVAKDPKRLPPPNEKIDNMRLPYFCIMTNQNNEITDYYGDYYDLSNTDLLNEILNEAVSSKDKVSVIKKYNLRFLCSNKANEIIYVFTDIGNEQRILKGLVLNCVIIGILTFIAFLGISIIFSKWAVNPIELAWNQQKQFIADASHELKTPLTVIMTDAELLHASTCTESDRALLSSSIISIAHQMRGLVESMLELAKIDNGSVKESMAHFSLSETIQDSVMIFEPIFFEKELIFDYQIEPNLEMTGIKSQIKQLVDILLDNATKYSSSEGHTNLSLTHTQTGKYLLSVSNQGNPIPQDELKNIFKRFYKIDKARSSTHSYGLGLSIAESIVNKHHGKIWAESKNGYNYFYVELV